MMSKKKVYMMRPQTPSYAKAIRAKCMDCASSANDVRDCHICKCPLWAYRFGKGADTAIRTLSQTYDVVLVNEGQVDYIEELKGKKLQRPQ